jgi:hypothetical protein
MQLDAQGVAIMSTQQPRGVWCHSTMQHLRQNVTAAFDNLTQPACNDNQLAKPKGGRDKGCRRVGGGQGAHHIFLPRSHQSSSRCPQHMHPREAPSHSLWGIRKHRQPQGVLDAPVGLYVCISVCTCCAPRLCVVGASTLCCTCHLALLQAGKAQQPRDGAYHTAASTYATVHPAVWKRPCKCSVNCCA